MEKNQAKESKLKTTIRDCLSLLRLISISFRNHSYPTKQGNKNFVNPPKQEAKIWYPSGYSAFAGCHFVCLPTGWLRDRSPNRSRCHGAQQSVSRLGWNCTMMITASCCCSSSIGGSILIFKWVSDSQLPTIPTQTAAVWSAWMGINKVCVIKKYSLFFLQLGANAESVYHDSDSESHNRWWVLAVIMCYAMIVRLLVACRVG